MPHISWSPVHSVCGLGHSDTREVLISGTHTMIQLISKNFYPYTNHSLKTGTAQDKLVIPMTSATFHLQISITISVYIIWLAANIAWPCNIEPCNIIQIWTGYEGNSAKYMPEGVRVDNYFPRPEGARGIQGLGWKYQGNTGSSHVITYKYCTALYCPVMQYLQLAI